MLLDKIEQLVVVSSHNHGERVGRIDRQITFFTGTAECGNIMRFKIVHIFTICQRNGGHLTGCVGFRELSVLV